MQIINVFLHILVLSICRALSSKDVQSVFDTLEITEETLNRRMSGLFDAIDSDKNGVLNENELLEWVKNVQEKSAESQVSHEILQLDRDKDGYVSLAELLALYGDVQGAEEHGVSARFQAVDLNSDGKLDKRELLILLNPGANSELLNIEVNEILRDQDTNKDGKLSVEEFIGSIPGDPEVNEATRASIISEFKIHDTDGDGFIDRSEMEQAMRDPHKEEAAEAMEVIKKLTGNLSEITRDMWMTEKTSFAISALTDNGEILRFPKDYASLGLTGDAFVDTDEEEEGVELVSEIDHTEL